MTLPYRANFRLADDDDAVRVASEQFRVWLRSKAQNRRGSIIEEWDWPGDGVHQIGPSTLLQVVSHEGDDGGRRQLLELRELSTSGTWTTRLYSASLPSSKRLKQALWLSTESAEGITPKAPGIAKHLIEATDVWNGNVPVRATPTLVDDNEIDELYGYLIDGNRDLSIVVAAPIGIDPETWRDAVAGLVRDSVGTATAFVLTDASFESLNARLPPAHQVPSGTVRTFLPDVDVNDAADSRRHRILGARTMARNFERGRFTPWLVERHSRTAREHLAKTKLPSELVRVETVLEKLRLQQLRAQPSQATGTELLHSHAHPSETVSSERDVEAPPTPSASISERILTRLNALVLKFTNHAEASEKAVADLEGLLLNAADERATSTQQIDQLLDHQLRQSEQKDALEKQLEAEQLEREIAEASRRDAERHLRAVLHWKKQHALTEHVPTPGVPLAWEDDPEDMQELVYRFSDDDFSEVTEYVVLTDPDKALDRAAEIDDRDPLGRYGSAFWEYVLVLRDYVIAHRHGFAGGVHDYLLSDITDGRKCPPTRHRPTESEQVAQNGKWRAERVLPVPEIVDPSGTIYMDAHFAPTHRDTFAPRMHYHSDVAGTGKIYIGYIGRHLTNTKTN